MGAVSDSLAAMSEPDRGCLERVFGIARGLAPEAVEGMSYGMPALKLDGKPLIGVVAAAKHLSIFPFSPAVVDAVAPQLDGYSLSKGTVRFTPDHPVPDDVVAEMIRLRMAEIRKHSPSVRPSGMGENSEELDSAIPATGAERFPEPVDSASGTEQGRSIGDRRRDAEAKLEQHLRQARDKETEADGEQ
jgi:uncharacterized protein YdhG (YjbR/CyaY superfamily)